MDLSHAIDLARRLTAAGRPLLGFGDAALVLGAGPRWALKVGYDGADGWPAWARWCREQSCPHLPHIAALHVLEHDAAPVAFLALVERLGPSLAAARWMKADRLLKRDPRRLADQIEDQAPSVAAMLRRAAGAFPTARWDAGPSNWLERPDGTLVLMDPLSRAADAISSLAA